MKMAFTKVHLLVDEFLHVSNPSIILTCFLFFIVLFVGNGVVIHIPQFFEELEALEAKGTVNSNFLAFPAIDSLSPQNIKIKIQEKSQILFCKTLKNKWCHVKVLNGYANRILSTDSII